jgi:hypothetical protein
MCAGRDAHARVLDVQHEGALKPGTLVNALMVGRVEIVVPPIAKIAQITREGRLGIQIVSDFEPPPTGLWIWIGCDVVAHCHDIFEELRAA